MRLALRASPDLAPGVGGPARYFVEARSVDDLREAAAWADAQRLPLFLLGGGSNLHNLDMFLVTLALLAGMGAHAWRRTGSHCYIAQSRSGRPCRVCGYGRGDSGHPGFPSL